MNPLSFSQVTYPELLRSGASAKRHASSWRLVSFFVDFGCRGSVIANAVEACGKVRESEDESSVEESSFLLAVVPIVLVSKIT